MSEMNRFRLSEITGERIIQGFLRRITQVRSNYSWKYSPEARQNRERLQGFRNRFMGKRCFIIANGPSLATMDLTPLCDEITFGMNRIYLLFDQLGFETTFFVAINELVLQQYSKDIAQLNMPKFVNWDCRDLFTHTNDCSFVKLKLALRDQFSKTILEPICSGGTVTFATLQIAFFMGFQKVILIGLDHNFSSKGVPNTIRVRETKGDRDHFHPNYFPEGIKWQLPDLTRSELAYSLARKAFEEERRVVLDATVGGNCMVFEKVPYLSLFD